MTASPIEIEVFTPDQLKRILEQPLDTKRLVLKYVSTELWRDLGIEAPKDQGELAGSFRSTQQDENTWLINSGRSYALAVNEGSRPHTPPWDPIAKWAERHGLEPGAVWHNIKTYGTAPNNYVDRAIESANRRVDEFIRRAVAETIGGRGGGGEGSEGGKGGGVLD